MITINGTTIASPSSFQYNMYTIGQDYRTASAKFISKYIADKRKLELGFSILTNAEYYTIISLVKSSSRIYSITYPNPNSNGSTTTMSAYTGDLNVGMVKYIGGIPMWTDLKFSAIEV